MKTVKRALFAFDACGYKAAQSWLTELYEEGWELQTLPAFSFWPAVFVPRTRDGLKYCVDLNTDANVRRPYIAPDAYRQLVTDSGWEVVGVCNGMAVYKSRPGTDPAPIQTDPELERGRFWRCAVLPNLVGLLFLLALFALFAALPFTRFQSLALLGSNWQFLRGLSLAVLLAYYPFTALRSLLAWKRFSFRAPAADVRLARRRGLLAAAVQVLYLYAVVLCSLLQFLIPNGLPLSPSRASAYPLLQADALDLGEPYRFDAHRQSSLFLETVTTEVWCEDGVLEQTRYGCRFAWVADLVVEETLSSYQSYLDGLAPVELDFDGSWRAGIVLLLREGNTVVLLHSPADLTAPALRPALRALF